MITKLLLILVYLAVSSYGLFQLKRFKSLLSMEFISGMTLYAIGFAIWIIILKKMPLSVAFPIAAGGLIICTQLIGSRFLGETIAREHLFGIMLILAGIALVFRST